MSTEEERRMDRGHYGFARLYAGLAGLVVVLSCQSLFERTSEDQVTPMDSVWAELVGTGHSAAVVSVVFLLALIAFLIAGAFDVRSVVVPVGILAGGLVLMLMIITRPGYGEPTPELTSWGGTGIALGIFGMLLAGAHLWFLVAKRRAATAPASR